MVCAACGSDNDPGVKFCNECGAPLSAICPRCSAPNRPGSKFCGECGGPLTVALPATASPTSAPQGHLSGPNTQRRVVSVLFADLVGFTTISERRDAEDVRELLGHYFEAARAAVERHGGIVEKFIGDAVMAVWGTDVAHEDDAERAVRAALEVVESVAALGTRLEVDLAARAGVLTGEAAVTVGAQGQGLVAGDLVNTASRLQSAAEPGTVLVGAATYRAASDAISFEGRDKIAVKGKDEPVEVWRAVRVVGERRGGGRPGRPEPPFVGRAEELRLIKDLLHVTGREQRPRLVSVTGIGGIGKSRLAWEFQKYVDGLAENVFWHQGRCPSYGEGITFWALGEMVRMRAGIAETDVNDEARQKLAAMLDAQLRDVDERRWVEQRLGHLLGLADAPPGDREELFSAWRTLFERIAEQGPTVLVFEDLHWADAGLLDFVESILEWSKNSGILIVTLARPELLDRRPTWGAGLRNYIALHLDSLGSAPMTELVDGFVTDLPATDTQRIVARSEGVPLYAVETIRMLADRGVLGVDGRCYRMTGEIGDLDVPSSLHALVAARLDVLPADVRELLRDATVLGTSFTVESLAGVRQEPIESLETRLHDLVRREYLTQEMDPRSPERGQYAFLQGIIREVAYGTLSKADRRNKHLAVARQLESLDDEEVAGAVASHYVEALRATPEGPDATELAETVRRKVSDAARRALSLGSPDQAQAYIEQALEITPEQDRAPLLELAGDAALRAGHFEQAIGYLERAQHLFSEAGDLAGAARAAVLQARPLLALDRLPRALELLEAAHASLPDVSDDRVRVMVLDRLGESLGHTGRATEGIALLEQALALAERLGDQELILQSLAHKSGLLYVAGRQCEAVLLGRGTVDLAATSGTRRAHMNALFELSVMLAKDSQRQAYDAMIATAEAARRAGVREPELISLANAVEMAIGLGLFAHADDIITELNDRLSGPSMARTLAWNKATLAAYRADDVGAAELLSGADWNEGHSLAERTWRLHTAALVQLLAGDPAGAYELGAEAVVLEPDGLNALSAASDCAHAAAWLRDADKLKDTLARMQTASGAWIENLARATTAALDAVQGRTDESRTMYAAALAEWERLDLPLAHAWTVVDALAVHPPGALDDEAVRTAREFLTSIRATALLRRFDPALASLS
ncbi:MAG TPA: adenylate/guanylate cyclase domain-containing protein [Mycobacteriales bacterium]|jgi:class 3 adenylate cyclase/tetratricopeptide (TPR) repeat protein|nr:adenylate/guanylate cyclase domain-containing protein [Mycobacteriales bacterium]